MSNVVHNIQKFFILWLELHSRATDNFIYLTDLIQASCEVVFHRLLELVTVAMQLLRLIQINLSCNLLLLSKLYSLQYDAYSGTSENSFQAETSNTFRNG